MIGEIGPFGFGLWEPDGILPLATYPQSLHGCDLAVDRFLQLGDRPLPFAVRQRGAARRAS